LPQEASNCKYVLPSHSQQLTVDGLGVFVGVAVIVIEGVIEGVTVAVADLVTVIVGVKLTVILGV
jgi:hypothetical protein